MADKSLEELLLMDPSAGTSGTRSPIGVEPGYVAGYRTTRGLSAGPSSVAGSMEPILPRYFDGDEWVPAQSSTETQAELQQRMAAAGLLSGEFRLGVWDTTSRNAYKQLLGFANASGLTAEQALVQWAKGASVRFKGGQRTGGGGAGPQITKGDIENTMSQLRDLAEDYVVPLSDQALSSWANSIVRGNAGRDSFEKYVKEQAKSKWPGLAEAIDRGISVREYADPYLQTAAKVLERPPESFSLLDSNFGKALDVTDPNSGQRKAMTLAEWEAEIKTNPIYGWRETQNFRHTDSELTSLIGRMFGRSA